MLTLKSFLEKRKVKKMVDDFGGPIKVKKVGPTEPKLYGKLTKSRLNTYSRETYSDSLNQRIHTAISQEIKTKEIINLERQKFISGLVFNLNLAPMVDLDTLSHLGSVSIETFGKTKTISSRESEKKFPEKYLEAQVGYIIMKFIFDSSDRNISRDVNVKFYNNGEYILFDFEGVENFFSYLNYHFYVSLEDRIEHGLHELFDYLILPDFKTKLIQKLIELKNFYDTDMGVERFKYLVSSSKVPFGELFPINIINNNDYISTPDFFHAEMIRKINLLLDKIK